MTAPTAYDLLRAVLDPVRLAVAGASVASPVSIESVADETGVPKKEIAKAAGDLRALGLLDEDGMIDREALRVIVRALPREPGPSGEPVPGPWTHEEAQILGRFFDGDRLVEIPQNRTKRRLVLEKITQGFEPGHRYPERDINFMIQLIHADYAAIRRYLVDEAFLDRADGVYWRIGGRYDVDEPVTDNEPSAEPRNVATALPGVELRPWDWDMIDGLVTAANDPRINRYMGDEFPHPYTRDDAESWMEIATKSSPPTQYSVHVDGIVAGGAGGFPARLEATGAVEIGWWLNPAHWGRGITTAAVAALVDEFFGERDHMRLWAPVMKPNVASSRVAEKAGLRLEGVAPSAYLKKGVRYDQLNYGLTRAQWRAAR
jgi:RimJ/RimL family protein N-acetyltransferase